MNMGFDRKRYKFTALEYFNFRHTCTSLKLSKPQLSYFLKNAPDYPTAHLSVWRS